jgi:hypothetical protein
MLGDAFSGRAHLFEIDKSLTFKNPIKLVCARFFRVSTLPDGQRTSTDSIFVAAA